MILKRRFKPDRRRRKRQLLNTSVQVFTESAQLDGLGINLSDVGMCLFTMANLQVGSQIQVEFLPPRSTELVRVSGIVRHRALYLYGVDFLVDSDVGTIPDRQALPPSELGTDPKHPFTTAIT
jgi:PilZ domain